MPTVTQRKIPAILEREEPFTGSNLRGEAVDSDHPWTWTGRDLARTGRMQYNADAFAVCNAEPEEIRYRVMSYATPIAYVTVTGRRVILPGRYSATTSRHQSLCRQAWGRECEVAAP
jgi:hypothetical protein